jgi:hypothetical protein
MSTSQPEARRQLLFQTVTQKKKLRSDLSVLRRARARRYAFLPGIVATAS